MDNEPEIG